MPLREDLFKPIPGVSPSGRDLRYDPVYDKIKEARREEDELSQGEWKRERKVADYSLVIKLTQEALATQSKDLQLSAWLSEALLKKTGYAGLLEGLALSRKLLEDFWDTLYPALDDGDAEFRAAPLEWIATKFDYPLKCVPLCVGGYNFYQYKESRSIPTEEQAQDKDKQKLRDEALKSNKIPPEVFDKSFIETPKAFYAQNEKTLDALLVEIEALAKCCDEKFGNVAPSFEKVRTAAGEARHAIHGFLQKKRETEPDPVAVITPEAQEESKEETGADGQTDVVVSSKASFVIEAPEDPADRRESVAAVVTAAAFLRKREPKSPAPYLMLRGLRWGELRAALEEKDLTKLEAPPGDVRRIVRKLSLEGRSKELIEAAENVMGLPCGRAWLDLQRHVVNACVALGSDYQLIAMAIRSELRALIRDLPQIPDMTLMDDTPAANAETKAWLKELAEEPESATPVKLPDSAFVLDSAYNREWRPKFVDSYELAMQTLRAGNEARAFDILHAEIQRQTSGRGRFERRLQMVQLCAATGNESIMQPYLEDLIAAIETHKLEDWEDRGTIAAALLTIIKASKEIQGDAKEKQKLFERICRLDPSQALGMS